MVVGIYSRWQEVQPPKKNEVKHEGRPIVQEQSVIASNAQETITQQRDADDSLWWELSVVVTSPLS